MRAIYLILFFIAGALSAQLANNKIGQSSAPENSNGPPSAGYNLFTSLFSEETYLVDNNHNILKTWTRDNIARNTVYLLEDGSLMGPLYTGSPVFYGGGAGGRVEQHDWDGNLIWSFDYDTADYRQHHDIKVLPNGNILIVAWQMKTREEAIAAGRNPDLLSDGELWPDSVIEVAPTKPVGGTIVWEWHVWDHLIQDYDASKDNYGTVADYPGRIDLNFTRSGPNAGIADWNHINSIDYNAELDQIILSVHSFSEIWIIDHDTTTTEAAGSAGDLLYRWGNPAAYASGDLTDQQLFKQHNAHWIGAGLPGEGNILIFNNGEDRPEGDYSSVEEIIPPILPDGTYTLGLPLSPLWNYTSSPTTDFYASRISGAQRLPNGNTLICEGTEKYAFEVTPNGELVWDYNGPGRMFRFERYSPDYPGFQNTEFDPDKTDFKSSLQGDFEFIGDHWIDHNSLGILWGDGIANGAWFYSPNFGVSGGGSGWLWTSVNSYPYFYRINDEIWLWHVAVPLSQCWFYQFNPNSFVGYDWISLR